MKHSAAEDLQGVQGLLLIIEQSAIEVKALLAAASDWNVLQDSTLTDILLRASFVLILPP